MANDMFEHEGKQEVGISPKPLQCRFHKTEEYQIFCKDCKDFMCFKCLGQLHQKHDLSQLQDAEEDIRKEMEDLFFKGKHAEQLHVLSDKLTENKKTLVKDDERLNYEIRTSVEKMKLAIDLTEKNLLSELRYTFESYEETLYEQATNINNLLTEITDLAVNKLHEYNHSHIMNILSETKLCSFMCDKITNQPIPSFTPTMEFSIGNITQAPKRKHDAGTSSLICSDVSAQTDLSEDSDTEWFDAEDKEDDDLIEKSSDEAADEKDEYPVNFQLKQDIKLVRKIVPISEKDAWIIANRKLLKIVDHSVQDEAYADKVDDIVVLKDGCVLILCVEKSSIMKLLTNRRLVRFADVGSKNCPYSYSPYCFCKTEEDSLIIYLWSPTNNEMYDCYHNRIIWMNTNGIMTKTYCFTNKSWNKPCSIQTLESGLCVLYRVDNYSNLLCIDLIKATSKTYNKLFDFNGIYGFDPKKNFECEGICVYKGNIFVSDFRHHSVYVLDQFLKYKNTLFDAKNGLDTPAAIGLLNDDIWVADGNKIFIFHYTKI